MDHIQIRNYFPSQEILLRSTISIIATFAIIVILQATSKRIPYFKNQFSNPKSVIVIWFITEGIISIIAIIWTAFGSLHTLH